MTCIGHRVSWGGDTMQLVPGAAEHRLLGDDLLNFGRVWRQLLCHGTKYANLPFRKPALWVCLLARTGPQQKVFIELPLSGRATLEVYSNRHEERLKEVDSHIRQSQCV